MLDVVARCPDCGQFMKRGISNWVYHAYNTCVKAERNRQFRHYLTESFKAISAIKLTISN